MSLATDYCIACREVVDLLRSYEVGVLMWKCSKCGRTLDFDFDDIDIADAANPGGQPE
jgi:hypothetical protein